MIKDKIIQYRRYFHQNPEIGFQTYNTARYIKDILDGLGYDTTYVVNKAGVVAKLDLKKAHTIAFRSDVDALPIQEKTNLEYASCNNYMHACGHDAHMAILLGAAHLFIENKEKLKNNIILIFQPAEEGPLPGGALKVMEDYDLSDVSYFFAYHVTNRYHTGQIAIKENEACAAPDLWELEIEGKGCHGSTPDLGNNPILPASEIVSKFQELHLHRENPNTVITTTYFHSGVSMNVICDNAVLKGTARSFTQRERENLARNMQMKVDEVTMKYKIKTSFLFHFAYDPVFNDASAVKIMRKAAAKILKQENIICLSEPEMVGEDFSYYRRIAPTCLTWLGVRAENQDFYDLHNSSFILDENALEQAAQIIYEINFSI